LCRIRIDYDANLHPEGTNKGTLPKVNTHVSL